MTCVNVVQICRLSFFSALDGVVSAGFNPQTYEQNSGEVT